MYERESNLPSEAIAIFIVVMLNAVLGYVQEARADEAVAALRRMPAAQAKVIRDGTRRSLAATDAVPRRHNSHWKKGDSMPADARVIQTTALQTAEACTDW